MVTKADLEAQIATLTAERDTARAELKGREETITKLLTTACDKKHPLPPNSHGFCAACELNKEVQKIAKSRRYVEMAREVLQRAAAPKWKKRQRSVRSALELLDMASETIAPPLPPWLSSVMGGVIGLLWPMLGGMAAYLAMKRG